MAEGILIDYNDGKRPMEITAGLRAPSYCASFSGWGEEEDKFTVTAPLTDGSTIIVVPTNPVYTDVFAISQVNTPIAILMSNFTRNGNTSVTIHGVAVHGNSWRPNWSGHIIEILPASANSEGLFVSNSTNFTAISSNSRLMTCAYIGRVTINGSMRLPVSGIPFGKWDNRNVSVGFDGTSIIVRDINYKGTDDVKGSVTMDLVIFNQSPPEPCDGITMTNKAGQVTFSTKKKPFVYDRLIKITDSFQNIGNVYCQILFTGFQKRVFETYENLRMKGIVMASGEVKSAYNRRIGNLYMGDWCTSFNGNIDMPILTLPDIY
ncbi:hypothetical protein HVX40_24230 (plasmid) [Escherichia coli]|nr:hypothetical protein [Escherichia coli]ELD1608944.1 hypothetical protein [Escherichia coli]MBA8354112.1 hypothetical protein [Escherichia coli]